MMVAFDLLLGQNRKDTLARKTSTNNIKRKTIYQEALAFRADIEKIKKTKILFSVKNLSMKKIAGGRVVKFDCTLTNFPI